jgi:hypothetical protein
VDVRDAPIVPDDGDSGGLLLPARHFRILVRLESDGGGCGGDDENQPLSGKVCSS